MIFAIVLKNITQKTSKSLESRFFVHILHLCVSSTRAITIAYALVLVILLALVLYEATDVRVGEPLQRPQSFCNVSTRQHSE